jgi:hypothetical protein
MLPSAPLLRVMRKTRRRTFSVRPRRRMRKKKRSSMRQTLMD